MCCGVVLGWDGVEHDADRGDGTGAAGVVSKRAWVTAYHTARWDEQQQRTKDGCKASVSVNGAEAEAERRGRKRPTGWERRVRREGAGGVGAWYST